MDPIATALAAAWLDAVRRVQSDRVQRLEQIMPEPPQASGERQLTDIIEGGLAGAGAAPPRPAENGEPGRDRNDARPSIRLVDVLV
jgi:hypothetical protein